MKKGTQQEPLCTTTEQQFSDSDLIESVIDSYNFERMECIKILSDTFTSFGWLIFAFSCLHVIRKWLFSKD